MCLWAGLVSASADMPDCLYEEWRKSPFPQKGAAVPTNPSPLLWPSVRYWEKKDVAYNVYLSRDQSFPERGTMRSMGQRHCFFNPHRKLEPGTWYWTYEVVEDGKAVPQGVFSFEVEEGTEGVATRG